MHKHKCKNTVWVKFSFEALHKYPDAPDEVAFLRNEHRHVFHVKAGIDVRHDDREIEFILLKRGLEKRFTGGNMNNKSCEMIADEIAEYFLNKGYKNRTCYIEVSEDNENGSYSEYTL